MSATVSGTSTQPAPQLPRLGPIGTVRFAWRQLTSMRTALFLLMLLAVAAVPGSVLPQRGVDPSQVTTYFRTHPGSAPWLDRLGGFDVYSSVWFSAIYLLLFVSLVGCVLPRSRQHLRAVLAQPPAAPRRFERMPAHREIEVDATPDQVLDAARAALRSRRYRLRAEGLELSAERGYLRETGNLVFHLALLGLLLAVAAGHLLGWRGQVVVAVGERFSNTSVAYNSLDAGPWVDVSALPPFQLDLDRLDVAFEQRGPQQGQPRDFRATVTSRTAPDAASRRSLVEVNHPLQLDGASVFLLGNGYAPVITVRDAKGDELYSAATPFLNQDGNYTSVGVVKVVGAAQQIGLQGLFLPTVAFSDGRLPVSVFPDLKNPALALTPFVGDLGLASGQPQSVFVLDTTAMERLQGEDGKPVRLLMAPGDTAQLPDGLGSVTFDRVERYAGFSVRHDPGRVWALVSAIFAMIGLALSLFVPRRRVFVRARPVESADGTPRTVVETAALARGEDTGLDDELDRLLAALTPQRHPTLEEAPA